MGNCIFCVDENSAINVTCGGMMTNNRCVFVFVLLVLVFGVGAGVGAGGVSVGGCVDSGVAGVGGCGPQEGEAQESR